MNFDDGIRGYIVGECTVQVHFPVNWNECADVTCQMCKFFSRASGICYLTKEISEYPTRYIGSHCPLNFTGEIVKSKQE